MSYGAPPAPGQPPTGPVRSRGGLVDVTVTPTDLVLVPRGSWRDWLDSDLVLALLALLGIVVALAGLAVGGPLGVVVSLLGVLMFLPLAVLWLVTWATVAYVVVAGLFRATTRRGRARLKRGAARMIATAGSDGRRLVPRSTILGVSAVEVGWRARLRIATHDGEVMLSTPRRHRGRLEAIGWALHPR